MTSLCDKLEEESKQEGKVSWTQLFKKIRFFPRFEHFLKIDILSQDIKENFKWTTYVETQLKRLSDSLAQEHRDFIQEIRINPRAFNRQETQDTINMHFQFCTTYFLGLKFNAPPSDQMFVDLRTTIMQFTLLIDMHRVDKQTNDLRIMSYRQKDLSQILLDYF